MKKKNKFLKGMFFTIVILSVGVLIALTLNYFNLITLPFHHQSEDIETVDAETYISENSSIIKKMFVKDSDQIQTEREVINEFADRGFSDYPITTQYNLDGDYLEETDISSESKVRHPMYEGTYISENNETWMLLNINGELIALPFSYNIQNSDQVPIVISENEYINSYDSHSNQFFHIIPDSDTMKIKTVSRIDAKTLDTLTVEVLGSL